jgi:hypothetical protein
MYLDTGLWMSLLTSIINCDVRQFSSAPLPFLQAIGLFQRDNTTTLGRYILPHHSSYISKAGIISVIFLVTTFHLYPTRLPVPPKKLKSSWWGTNKIETEYFFTNLARKLGFMVCHDRSLFLFFNYWQLGLSQDPWLLPLIHCPPVFPFFNRLNSGFGAWTTNHDGIWLWDMVQRDIKIGMNMHAMIQALCGFLVFCLYRSSIHWNWPSLFCRYRDTPQGIVFFLLIFDCLASPVNSIILFRCDWRLLL